MQNTIKILAAITFVSACADQSTSGNPVDLSDSDHTELARHDIASAVQDGARIALLDRSGNEIGSLRLEGQTVETSLASHHLITTSTSDTVAIECDGRGISLARAETVSTSAFDAVASCDGTRAVQGIILQALAAVPSTEPAAIPLLQAYGCTALGSNVYCDGDTMVYSLDSLCYDAVGNERIETVTYYIFGASGYCT